MSQPTARRAVAGLRKGFCPLEVLRGIDLTGSPQELVFVIGPSGSGKSTLLRCCNRLEEPDQGSVRVDGVELLDPATDINAMRRRIGRSEEHTSELQSLMRISYAVFCLKKKNKNNEANISKRYTHTHH